MSEAKDEPDLRATAREGALFWFTRMNSGDANAQDRAGYAAWVKEHPRNQHAYEQLGDVWRDIGAAGDPRARATVVPMRPATARPSRRMILSGGLAACAAGGWFAVNGLPDFLQSDAYTGTGVLQRAMLPDGSAVDLDADSAFALGFTDRSRSLHLQRGRALFEVAQDPRPFEVRAAGGVISAGVSRFSVHIWDGTTTVAVENDAVIVQTPQNGVIRLAGGERLSFGKDASAVVEAFDPGIETAWLRGKMIFEDRPLRQVLADVNRYRPGTIQVTSDALLNMRVSGIFDISRPDAVLEAIEQSLPLRSTHVTRYLVVLRPA